MCGSAHIFSRVLATYSLVERALCTSALSSWNKKSFPGNCRTMPGQILFFRMLMYLSAFIFPSTFVSVPTPLYQMHPHTMTLNLRSVLPFTKCGLHPSHVSAIHIHACPAKYNITLLPCYRVVHHLFSLHHANRFYYCQA